MLEELGLRKLQERKSIAKLKTLRSFYHGYKFVTPSLLPSKARSANLRFKPILSRERVYERLLFPSIVSLWNKLPPHIADSITVEQFFDYVSDLDLQPFA